MQGSASTQNHAQPLKRLHVLQQAGTLAYATGEEVYRRLRPWAPPLMNPGLERLENVASSVVPGVSEAAEQLLRAADARVDTLLSTAHNSEVSRRLRVDQLLNALSAAGDYAVIVAKEGSASVAAGVQTARDTLQTTVDKAREAADPDVALNMAWEAWTKFTAYPPVKAFVERAEPATNLVLQAFVSLHDGLVVSPAYKSALDTTASTLSYASTTTPYKLGAQYVYPIVKPVAEPAITKVAHSKVFSQVLDYWKPQERPAPAPVNAH